MGKTAKIAKQKVEADAPEWRHSSLNEKIELTQALHSSVETDRTQAWFILKMSNGIAQVIEMLNDELRHWRILGEYHNVRCVLVNVNYSSGVYHATIREGSVMGLRLIVRHGTTLEAW